MNACQVACSYVWWLSLVTLAFQASQYPEYYRSTSFEDFLWGLRMFFDLLRLLIITFCILNLIYL